MNFKSFIKSRIPSYSYRSLIFIGVFLCFGLWTSTQYFSKASQKLNYQLFRTYDTLSWRQEGDTFFRYASQAGLDTVLLTKEKWDDVDFRFRIDHPRSSGLVYNYEASDDFHYIILDGHKGAVIWTKNKSGKMTHLQKIKASFSDHVNVHFKRKENTAQLFVNDKEIASLNIPSSTGRIGLLLNDAKEPKVTFSDIQLKGYKADGEFIEVHVSRQNTKALFAWLLAMMVVVSFMVSLAMCLMGAFLKAQKDQEHKTSDPDKSLKFYIVCGIHLILTIIIFYPFVLKGHVLVSSSDNYEQILPLLYLSKWKFSNIIQGVSWGLWNQYLHNGTPFFSSYWDMVYYPLNWPFFLLSDQHFLLGITLRQFLEVFLIGVFAYKFFEIEIRSKQWALFCSVVLQLNAILIFANTLFPAVSLIFSTMLILYLVWSMPIRQTPWNYLFLTCGFVLMLTPANIAFVFYAALMIAVLCCYRFIQAKAEGVKQFIIVGVSFLTGLLISSVRIIPALLGPFESYRVHTHLGSIRDRLALLTRLFVPEIASTDMESFNPLRVSGMIHHFGSTITPQIAFMVYFGVIPAILLLLCFFIKAEGRFLFWKRLGFITLAVGLWFQPVFGFLHILTFPVKHAHYLVIAIPFGLCALFGFVAQHFQSKKIPFQSLLQKAVLGLLVVEVYILVMLCYIFPDIISFVRLLFFVGGLWYGVFYFIRYYRPKFKHLYLWLTGLISEVLIFSLLLFTSVCMLSRAIPHKEALSANVLLPCLFVLMSILVAVRLFIYVTIQRQRFVAIYRNSLYMSIPAVIIISFVVMTSPIFKSFLNAEFPVQIYLGDFLYGQLKFLIIAPIALCVFAFYQRRYLTKRSVMVVLLVVTALDLVVFNLRFDNVAAPAASNRLAFAPMSFPYIYKGNHSDLARLDLDNYRVTHHNHIGIKSNENLLFGLRSYTGTTGYLRKRFVDFINHFGYPKSTYYLTPMDSSRNDRFLDLSAVGYIFVNNDKIIGRPTALTRLSLFHNFEVISDPKRLFDRLNQESFSPKGAVLLEQQPKGIVSNFSPKLAESIPILSSVDDRIRATVTTAKPAVLLFNESFHKGWRAYVDGNLTEVLPANHNFMACIVPAGSHEVVFSFKPRSFFVPLGVSILGIVLLLGGVIWAFSQKKSSLFK